MFLVNDPRRASIVIWPALSHPHRLARALLSMSLANSGVSSVL